MCQPPVPEKVFRPPKSHWDPIGRSAKHPLCHRHPLKSVWVRESQADAQGDVTGTWSPRSLEPAPDSHDWSEIEVVDGETQVPRTATLEVLRVFGMSLESMGEQVGKAADEETGCVVGFVERYGVVVPWQALVSLISQLPGQAIEVGHFLGGRCDGSSSAWQSVVAHLWLASDREEKRLSRLCLKNPL